MDYNQLPDEKVAAELGQKLARLRQRRGYSQHSLATALRVPPALIEALERGVGDLLLLVAVLRQLRAFDQLDRFLMETRARSLELSDPCEPGEDTVRYRRRYTDFSTEPVIVQTGNPRRNEAFELGRGPATRKRPKQPRRQ